MQPRLYSSKKCSMPLQALPLSTVVNDIADVNCSTIIQTSCGNQCQRLKVIVILPRPWSILPGAPRNPDICLGEPFCAPVNGPPSNSQFPFTPGAPWCVKMASKPCVVPRPVKIDPLFPTTTPRASWKLPRYHNKYDVPVDVYAKYGESLASAQMFQFNFRDSTIPEAAGEIFAYGLKGQVQASLKFVYRWCGPQSCSKLRYTVDETDCERLPAVLPAFEITKCTAVNAKFVALGNVLDFLPSAGDTSCYESVVVLGLQQYCCADFEDQVHGVGEDFSPYGCAETAISCIDAARLKECDKV